MERFCRVAVDSPVRALDRPFDYRIPERLAGRVRVGSVVRVPLHGRRMRAYVTELLAEPAVPDPKALSALVGDEPLFDSSCVDLARWMARRYLAPLGLVLHQATPGRYSAPAGSGPPERPASRRPERSPAPGWLEAPEALEAIVAQRGEAVVVAPDPQGEIEVVRHLVGLAAGGLVLAPRVALIERLHEALPGSVRLHGDLSPAVRARAWAASRDGAAAVLVGGRAAVLAPLGDPGVVCVASAHDRTLKEERSPRFHALAVARQRARAAGAAFVAVSASPPLDLIGDGIRLIEPARRGRGRIRPEVVRPGRGGVTERLLDACRWATAQGRDALVFTGRKGFALRVRCRECGWYPRCGDCRTGLTLFGGATEDRELRCRACGRRAALPTSCPECRGAELDGAGWGVERLAAALRGVDLGAPVIRVDADEPLPAERPRPAVIVGTQAAAWALEGADVALVAVADLDQLLGLPDFRAGEHAIQTLHDLAGVLASDGRFLVQTREADHHVVQAFTRRSYRWFTERELPLREAAGYPPFGTIVHIEAPAADLDTLRTMLGEAELIGPLPRGRGRAAALVRAADLEPLLDPLGAFVSAHPEARVDVDPVDVL